MAIDSFTNTNGTALTSHSSAWVYANIEGQDDDGRIYDNGVSCSLWNTTVYYRNDSSSNESQILLLASDAANSKVSPAVRMASGHSGYSFRLESSGSNWVTLHVYKNMYWQDLAQSLSYPKSSNYTLRIVASGTSSPVTISCYIDGSLIKSWNDSSSPYTSGAPGIIIYGDSANNNAFGDDWTDNAVVASTALPRRALDGPFYGSLRGSVR